MPSEKNPDDCPTCGSRVDQFGCLKDVRHSTPPAMELLPATEVLPIHEETVAHFNPHPTATWMKWSFVVGFWYIGWRKLYRWECAECAAHGKWQPDRKLADAQAARHKPEWKTTPPDDANTQ